MKNYLFFILLFASQTIYCQNNNTMKNIDSTPITGFELNRYLGKWYEIARYPHSFEKNLEGVTASYSLKKNGMVKVLNAGYKNSLDGKYKTATGKAKYGSDPQTGYLKVSFFLFFYGDYFIMELDKDYQWALIGSSSPNYLWILSREPQMDDNLYKELLKNLEERGYDLTKLYKVQQARQK
jgi:lipocalin